MTIQRPPNASATSGTGSGVPAGGTIGLDRSRRIIAQVQTSELVIIRMLGARLSMVNQNTYLLQLPLLIEDVRRFDRLAVVALLTVTLELNHRSVTEPREQPGIRCLEGVLVESVA